MVEMTMDRRPRPRPPEPVDIGNERWVARAWQWVFDSLIHLDDCVDEAKNTQNEFHAEMTASLEALKANKQAEHSALATAFEAHIQVHKQEASVRDGRSRTITTQVQWIKETVKAGAEVIKFAVALGALRLLGIL
jgi:hypothetical protein